MKNALYIKKENKDRDACKHPLEEAHYHGTAPELLPAPMTPPPKLNHTHSPAPTDWILELASKFLSGLGSLRSREVGSDRSSACVLQKVVPEVQVNMHLSH